jgi:hypothetical protein
MSILKELDARLTENVFRGYKRNNRLFTAYFNFLTDITNNEQTPETEECKVIGTLEFLAFKDRIVLTRIDAVVGAPDGFIIVDDIDGIPEVRGGIWSSLTGNGLTVINHDVKTFTKFIIVDDIDGL